MDIENNAKAAAESLHSNQKNDYWQKNQEELSEDFCIDLDDQENVYLEIDLDNDLKCSDEEPKILLNDFQGRDHTAHHKVPIIEQQLVQNYQQGNDHDDSLYQMQRLKKKEQKLLRAHNAMINILNSKIYDVIQII